MTEGRDRPTIDVTPGAPGVSWRDRARAATGDGGGEWMGWSHVGNQRSFPWLGAFLLVVGAVLLLQRSLKVSPTGLLLLGLGIAFAAAWLLAHIRGAMLPALLLLAVAAARLLRDTGTLAGEGWTPLFLGIALLVAWAVSTIGRRARGGWTLWIGALLVLVGLSQVSDRLTGLPDLGTIWPILIVAAGLVLVVQSSLGSRTR